jgi:WS/DGAT/MGAT family acyltransferase
MLAAMSETPWYERLTALDATFLHLEDRSAHMHVGGMVLLEGKPPSYREVLALIESRLQQVPRYRQRLMTVPLGQGRPVWVDESQFDLEYHVRHTALPPPGGLDKLKKLAGRLLSQALDRDKPLWELWFVEGVGGDGFAIVSKTHHAMVDGISGMDIATVLLDTEPTPGLPPAPEAWKPRPAPGAAQLFKDSMKDQLAHPLQLARQALEPGSDARKLLAVMAGGIKPLVGLAQLGQAPASSLNVPIGPHRRFEGVRLSLASVKAVRASLGGTVNDVILAVMAGALRRLLLSRGEAPTDLRAMVPVSVRSPDQRGTLGNQVTAIFCPLPVSDGDPASRLAKVRAAMQGLKESKQAVGALALSRLGDFAPPTLAAQAARVQSLTRLFNVVVTNVPGPQFPLYFLGRRMRECYPVVPLAANNTIGIALLSYDGSIDVGLLGDADGARDLAVLAEGVRASADELLALAQAAPQAAQQA